VDHRAKGLPVQFEELRKRGIGLVELGNARHTQALPDLPQNPARTVGRFAFADELKAIPPLPAHTSFDAEQQKLRCKVNTGYCR
jgi:hypothetical protein